MPIWEILLTLSRRDPSAKRDFWAKVGSEVKMAKLHIRPLLRNWLLFSEQGLATRGMRIELMTDGESAVDKDLHDIRSAYLPETVLAYVSTLHFAGTCLSRDNLLECMELAAVIAEKDSDIAASFVRAGRMKELVEAFASCSGALAIATGEKKGATSSSKKLREMGWSRDLWSVRP
jgi:nuclear pore complex protein Nup107